MHLPVYLSKRLSELPPVEFMITADTGTWGTAVGMCVLRADERGAFILWKIMDGCASFDVLACLYPSGMSRESNIAIKVINLPGINTVCTVCLSEMRGQQGDLDLTE